MAPVPLDGPWMRILHRVPNPVQLIGLSRPYGDLADYNGSGNSAIHKALIHFKQATRSFASDEFMPGFMALGELLKDLREAERTQSIEALMNKWEPKFPSSFVDLLLSDLPAAISFAEELLKEAQTRLLRAFEALGGGHIIAVTEEQLHSEEYLARKMENVAHGKETGIPVYLDQSLAKKLGPTTVLFQFKKNEVPTLSGLARKMKSRFPLHINRNIQFYIDGKLQKAETHVITESEMVTVADFGSPSQLAQQFTEPPKQGYLHELDDRYSSEAAEVLRAYSEQLGEKIAGVSVGELNAPSLWEELDQIENGGSANISTDEIADARRAVASLVLFQAGASPTAIASVIDAPNLDWSLIEEEVRKWNNYYADKPEEFEHIDHDFTPATRALYSLVSEEHYPLNKGSIFRKILSKDDQRIGKFLMREGGWRANNRLTMTKEEYKRLYMAYWGKLYGYFIGRRQNAVSSTMHASKTTSGGKTKFQTSRNNPTLRAA